MAETTTPAPQAATQPVALTEAERRAAQEQAALARVPAEVRQAREARIAALAAMTPDQRRAHRLGQHLAAVARTLREETRRGVSLADVLGTLDATEAAALAWLFNEVQNLPAGPAETDDAPPLGAGMKAT